MDRQKETLQKKKYQSGEWLIQQTMVLLTFSSLRQLPVTINVTMNDWSFVIINNGFKHLLMYQILSVQSSTYVALFMAEEKYISAHKYKANNNALTHSFLIVFLLKKNKEFMSMTTNQHNLFEMNLLI